MELLLGIRPHVVVSHVKCIKSCNSIHFYSTLLQFPNNKVDHRSDVRLNLHIKS